MQNYYLKIVDHFSHHVNRIIDSGDEKIQQIPKLVVWLVYLMSLNVLLQGIADLVLKFGGYTPWIVQFPWRMDFLFLTAISVLMGYQTVVGIRRRELDVTRNSVQVGLLVEVGLVAGDIFFLCTDGADIPFAWAIRMPFIVLTTINIGILIYTILALDLFRDGERQLRLF